MELKKINNVESFFKVVDNCKGTVELVSLEGDCINLKSTLAQVLCLAKVFSEPELMKGLELRITDSEDSERIDKFFKEQI